MAQQSSLKVLEDCRVAPWSPETAASSVATSLPFTFFDVFWLRFPAVERVFFYDYPQPPSSFFDSVLPKLKHSLSLILHTFLPLAANLTWPADSPLPVIKYVPGDAVAFTVAESDADFNRLSGHDEVNSAMETRVLVPSLSITDERASLIAVQITLFPNSGFSIGITAHHTIMDGKSSTSFFKAWAYTCSKLEDSSDSSPPPSLPEDLVPFYDRSVIKDPSGIAERFANFSMPGMGGPNKSLKLWELRKGDPSKMVRKTFELTPSSISKLKKSAESKLEGVHASTFQVTCAYVIECIVKAEQTKQERLGFIVSVDCRSRMNPPIPATYFGNCIWSATYVDETKKLLEEEEGYVNGVKGINDCLKIFKEEDVVSIAEKMASGQGVEMKMHMTSRMFSVAGSPRFDVYGNDFGWGKPKKVDIVSIDKSGAFSLAEGKKNDGGVEVGIVLEPPVMEKFASLFVKGL